MTGFTGPMPSPGFKQAMSRYSEPSLEFQASGQIVLTKNVVLGAPRRAGYISDAYMSIGNCGRDNSGSTLGVELDITIGATSIFTTKPKILHCTGEAAGTAKTTIVSGEGVTPGVINGANAAYSAGAVIMGKMSLTRTASPATEMQNVAVVAILNPS